VHAGGKQYSLFILLQLLINLTGRLFAPPAGLWSLELSSIDGLVKVGFTTFNF
jgi:hypothetical protein